MMMEAFNEDVDQALLAAADRMTLHPRGPVKYGWGRKSAGSEVVDKNGISYWLRVQFGPTGKINQRLWDGEIDAALLEGIKKPTMIRVLDWEEEAVKWRASLMSLVYDEVCSATPELSTSIRLDSRWFDELKASLACLAKVQTPRVNVRQNLIDRRIGEKFGASVDTRVEKWVTCHGDMHWANLTSPNLWILDWEGWGTGPRGLDAAFLVAFSVLQEDLSRKIVDLFIDDLRSPEGRIALLFVCAE